jgi:hypothetical protein
MAPSSQEWEPPANPVRFNRPGHGPLECEDVVPGHEPRRLAAGTIPSIRDNQEPIGLHPKVNAAVCSAPLLGCENSEPLEASNEVLGAGDHHPSRFVHAAYCGLRTPCDGM